MVTVHCRKCPKTHEVAALQISDVLRDAPGWGFIWDTSNNGLEAWYYCDTCMTPIKALFVGLQNALAPLDMRYANFAHLKSQIKSAGEPARPSPDPDT